MKAVESRSLPVQVNRIWSICGVESGVKIQNRFSELERDDDDPLSMRSLSISFLGIIIASLTILLPSISILLGRPLSQGNEINSFHLIKKDGS